MIKIPNSKQFNVVIVGTGGQGLITLLKILAEAAMLQGFDAKTSELHGLAQRGGSVECHLRLGQKIHSPLVEAGGADLVIALEQNEALRACYYGSKKKTLFFINNLSILPPGAKGASKEEILRDIRKFSRKIIFLDASEIVKKETGSVVATGIYILGYASYNQLIPLKPNLILKAIEKVIPEKHLELNRKIFKLPYELRI